ncbi:MAG: cupin domain-containing protein [Bacteroidetes bacterium]|jgi:mannose-6-phosphate isomerase-like protein (cupin superfamily)|nr:MAG: cupin domain-containing protein [Bacteroidota bacterium]UCE69523.1 MAG: cupin domain-containing protein [Flavobacteriaceae bacterium]
MEPRKVNLAEKFSAFEDYWNPRIAGALNGQYIKLAKLKGDFVWHQHENEDELFLVIEGTLYIELADKTLEVNPGEFAIIPRGVLHRPRAPEEVKVLLFEPQSTLNTGNLENELTRRKLDSI